MATRTRRKQSAPAERTRRNPMLLIGLAGTLLIAIVLVVVLSNYPSQPPFVPEVTGQPHASIDSTLINHGDLKMEAYAESVFRIRNTGDQALRILGEPRVELVQGCCPPRAIVSQMTLQPGEETTITLRFTMHEMMGGPHEFRVHVLTNDPDQGEIPLTILSNWIEE
ncbi:MAG: DUF1573 domain-containing protein [Chloroflexi bacterium]|nr:DUF1573 domain-containing protein [Chloroflexota bacterium]